MDDQPHRPPERGDELAEAGWESEGGAVLPPGLRLTLRGPEDADEADLDAALEAAHRALPAGYRFERD